MEKYLADIEWGWLGHTKEYKGLKSDISDVCYDVADACLIPEICICDIVDTFRLHGYEIIKVDDKIDSSRSQLKTR